MIVRLMLLALSVLALTLAHSSARAASAGAPITVDDLVLLSQDDAGASLSLLANDTPGTFGHRLCGILTPPANGSASIVSNTTLVYTPDAGFNGVDSLVYQSELALTFTAECDSLPSDPATVTLIVNANPVLVTPLPDVTVLEDNSATTSIDLSTAFADADVGAGGGFPDELRYSVTVSDPSSFDLAEVSGSTLQLALKPDVNGTFTVSVTAQDNRDQIVADIDLATLTPASDQFDIVVTPVNDPPVANDDVATTDEDVQITVDVRANDIDVDSTPTVRVVSTSEGAAVVVGGGSIQYTPTADFFGSSTITYELDDGEFQDTATLTVTVQPINDPPVATDDIATMNEGTSILVDVLANDTDVDDVALTLVSASAGSGAATVSGSSIEFTPDPDFNGAVSISYVVADPAGARDDGTLDVTVQPVNDPPFVVSPIADQTYDEDPGPQTFVLLASVFDDPDRASDSDVLSFSATSSNTDLVTVSTSSTDLVLTFVDDAFGSASISVTATDLAGATAGTSFGVVVNGINDVPVAVDDTATMTEDQAGVTIDIFANDTPGDPDVLVSQLGTTLTIGGEVFANSSETTPTVVLDELGNEVVEPNGRMAFDAGTGLVTYVPKPDYSGTDFFSYTITDADGEESTGTVNITITPVNDPPTGAANTQYTVIEDQPLSVSAPGLLAAAGDPDPDDTLTTVLVTTPVVVSGTPSTPITTSFVFNADGSFILQPGVDFVGELQFTYFVDDGTTTNGTPLTVTIDVTEAPPLPDPPPPGEVEFDFQLADVPLELALGVEPNVLVLMDDSGSMDWAVLSNEAEGRMEVSTIGLLGNAAQEQSMRFGYPFELTTNTLANCRFCAGEVAPSQETIDNDTDFNGNNFGVWRVRSAAYNFIYYNPEVRYAPWRGLDPNNAEFTNSVPTAARLDPMDPAATIDLTAPLTYTTPSVPVLAGTGLDGGFCIGDPPIFCLPPNGKDTTTTNYYIPRYYTTTAVGVPDFDSPRTLVEIRNTGSTYAGGASRTDCADPLACTYDEEIQNFANWFTYYRSREYTTKNSLGRVIAEQDSIRIGYAAINNTAERLPIESMNVSFRAGEKRALLDQVYQILSSGGTPLRGALDRAGKHFACDSGDIFGSTATSSPGDTACPVLATPAGACQQNYTLMFTDGSWNSDEALDIVNRDGATQPGLDAASVNPRIFFNTDLLDPVTTASTTAQSDEASNGGSLFDGGIYADDTGQTLGDVAMRYYERDLHTTLLNNVPTTARDLAGAVTAAFGSDIGTMHQHMATFAIGFGVAGVLSDGDIPGDIASTVAWGDPFEFTVQTELFKIDDLRHAALNGRGAFLSAADPVGLNATMEALFEEFATGEGAASAVSFNSQEVQSGSRLFRGFYDTKANTGDLIAQTITSAGTLDPIPVWSAATQLDSIDPTNRVIVTFNPSSRAGIPFRSGGTPGVSGLTTAQSAQFTANEVDYLRGARNHERPFGDNLRERPDTAGLFGDIVHSTPVFIGAPPFFDRDRAAYPTNSLYSAYKSAQTSRAPRVFVASNDGMLHAVDANTGVEAFAFIPDKILNGEPFGNDLSQLTSSAYNHRYFNDLSPSINDIFYKPPSSALRQWRTVLVGGLRAGGKGYFALDISDPTQTTTEADASAQVLWEFTDADDTYPVDSLGVPLGGSVGALTDLQGLPIKDLGYAFSRPTLVMSNRNDTGTPTNKVWAAGFGNGYNSTAGIAKLFMLFVEAGVGGWGSGDFVKIDTGFGVPAAGEQNAGRPNGLGSPRFVDQDNDGTADFAYAGDLLGNLFRFDLRNSNPANWTSTRIFVARHDNDTTITTDDIQQPITTQPIVIRNPQEDEGFIIIFSTGSYITGPDGTSTEIQSIYGVWDRLEATPNATLLTNGRSLLVEQTLTNVVDPAFGSLRTISDNTVLYSAPSTTRGWYVDFNVVRALLDTDGSANPDASGNAPPAVQFPGERAIRNIQLRGGFIFVNSILPRDPTSCLASPGGFALTFNPATGGRGGLRTEIAFDLNNDGNFDDGDLVDNAPVAGIRFDDAVPTDSSFIGSKRFTQLSNREIDIREVNIGNGARTGRLSWQELD